MALTLTSPGFLSSLQDDLYFIAISSDYSGSTDLKYVFDVWVNGVQKIRSKVYPDPTTKRGYFDAGPIVRNEILYDWFNPYNDGTGPGSGGGSDCILSIPGYNGEIGIQYDIRLGYELSGSTFINQVSGTNYAGNWAAPLFKRKQSPSNIWDNKLRKYLTNRPKNISYNFESKLLIPFYNWNDTYTSNYILKYRKNGETGVWSEDFGFEYINNNPWLQLDIGVEALAKTFFGGYVTEFDTFNTIEVGFFDGSTYRDSVFLKRVCYPKYEPINLYFMNAYGMYDTAFFGLVSKLSLETERKSFNRLNKTFGNSSVSYYVDSNDGMVYNESKINFASKTNWTYKLTMDYPTDGEYQWLSELILSPQIYAELDGDYYPVTIKNTNFEYNQNIVNGLKTLDLEIELNQTRYAFTR